MSGRLSSGLHGWFWTFRRIRTLPQPQQAQALPTSPLVSSQYKLTTMNWGPLRLHPSELQTVAVGRPPAQGWDTGQLFCLELTGSPPQLCFPRDAWRPSALRDPRLTSARPPATEEAQPAPAGVRAGRRHRSIRQDRQVVGTVVCGRGSGRLRLQQEAHAHPAAAPSEGKT